MGYKLRLFVAPLLGTLMTLSLDTNAFGVDAVSLAEQRRAACCKDQTCDPFISECPCDPKHEDSCVFVDCTKAGCRLWTCYCLGAKGARFGQLFDCSGLVQWTYKHQSDPVSITGRACDQANDDDLVVAPSPYQRGDILFFNTLGAQSQCGDFINHVGMYIADDNFVHAAGWKTGIMISNLDDTISRSIGKKYSESLVAARRVKQSQPCGSISGKVYNDYNGDRMYQVGEDLLDNWHIRLYKNGNTVATTTTNATGQYSFTGLDPGTYSLNIPVVATGYIVTSPADPTGPAYINNVVVPKDPNVPDPDFGVHGFAGIWRTSGNVGACSNPSAVGKFWYEADYDDGSWTEINPPDYGWGCDNCSRLYRYAFTLTPSQLADLDSAKVYVVSDDKMRLYVGNQTGAALVRDEGCGICCVNIPGCGCGPEIPAIHIKPHLQPGKNVIAVQVTDPVGGEFFFGTVRFYSHSAPVTTFPTITSSAHRGDLDGNGCVDMGDVTQLANQIMGTGTKLSLSQAADINCDGAENFLDIVYLANAVFRGSPLPLCNPSTKMMR